MNRTAAAIAALFAISCASRQAVTTPPTAPPTALIVLVPDPDDNTVGRATVSNESGSVELASAWASTRVGAGAPPSPPTAMDAAEGRRMFGSVIRGLPPPSRHFTLYFQFGSDELTTESQALTGEILRTVTGRPHPHVIIVGHTDTVGAAATNYELGLRRAEIVRGMLVAAGLEPAAVEVTSHGEGDPLQKTPDETSEPRNRRVEIDVQ